MQESTNTAEAGSYHVSSFAASTQAEIRRLDAQVDLFWASESDLIERYGLNENMDFLDCGCGPGRLIERLKDQYPGLKCTGLEMDPILVRQSGKPAGWLASHLFRNMSSIDFDGDGMGGEYGEAFISLEPVRSEASQPFSFQTFRGVFRWYSYALHGTQDQQRIGKCITGGCINIGEADLRRILPCVQLGDLVEIRSQ